MKIRNLFIILKHAETYNFYWTDKKITHFGGFDKTILNSDYLGIFLGVI